MKQWLHDRQTREIAISLCLVAVSAISLIANGAERPGVYTSDPVTYTVRMTTSLKVPEGVASTQQIRVWHALPHRKPWSLFTGSVGVTGLQFSSGGRQEFDPKNNSHHLYWETTSGLAPGEVHRFLSQFEVRSMKRKFRPEEAKIAWGELESLPPLVQAASEGRGMEIHPRLQSVAEEIRGRVGPGEAVYEFCIWILEHVNYDASFPFETDNIAAIIEKQKGHCGHQAAVFRQLCGAVSIPVRTVHGLNLYEPDGVGELSEIRADYTNIHTWNEIYFPRVGWIEVDPSGGSNPYTIPSRLIQNNPWFQNYSVWVRADGEMRQPKWTFEKGKVTSEYSIEHLISYRAKEE